MNSEVQHQGFALLEGVHANTAQLNSYKDCPHDAFMGNGTRYKRFSQYRVSFNKEGCNLQLLPARPYTAPKEFNPVGGGIKRPYEALVVDFSDIIIKIIDTLDLDRADDWQINVHQNRSIASQGKKGQLTPEGRHKDGHEYVSISILGKENTAGATTRVWSDTDCKNPLWEREMNVGETVLLHDSAVYHDVTDLEPNESGEATRDILIIAFSRWRDRWYGEEHDSHALGS